MHKKTLQETITITDKRKLLLVIQSIQEALWRKLNSLTLLFSCNEELYFLQKVKDNGLASEGKSC